MKEDCVMKIMGQSYGRIITCQVLLLADLVLFSNTIFAQSLAKASICDYQETRQNVPINPNTNQSYTYKERNQEPFVKASISKEQIKECLRTKKSIQYHHILFEDYQDVW